MSLQTSSCICILYIKSCSFKGLSGRSTIFGFFSACHKTVKGVVLYMYLKHSTVYIDSRYIWVHGSTPKGFFWLLKYHFGIFSLTHGNHFPKFLAHVLSWVITYHHAKFQRNPPTGLARMIVDTQTYIYIRRPTYVTMFVRFSKSLC